MPFQPREEICAICGHTFIARGATAKYCSSRCKERAKREHKKQWNARQRGSQGCLDYFARINRQIDEYNTVHGTHYSYGQYVAFVLEPAQRKNGGNKQ